MLKKAWSFFNACANPDCAQNRMSGKLRFSGLRIGQEHYCSPQCIHAGLASRFQKLLHRPESIIKRRHRIPLGLLLLSRGEIKSETLKAAVQEQKNNPAVRIGQILLKLGAVTEDQITAAIASQWSVPVFPLNSSYVSDAAQLLPYAFMERYKVLPVHYVKQRNHLHLAFADVIDRTLVYAIEQMLGVTTESCIAKESGLLQLINLAGQQQRPAEYVLNRVPETELAGIVRGYAERLRADEIHTVLCNDQIWVRMNHKSAITHFLFGAASGDAPQRMQLR